MWDAVATCESGGRWDINTGNGYYGGLQFSASTWRGFGGTQYGTTANKATREQQIEIAQRVLAKQGPGAWPTCSRKAGLTRENGAAAIASPTPPAPAAKPVPRRALKAKPMQSVTPGKRYLAVAPGQTLSQIARVNGMTWQQLYTLNRATMTNPHRIFVGQQLTLG